MSCGVVRHAFLGGVDKGSVEVEDNGELRFCCLPDAARLGDLVGQLITLRYG